MNIYVHKDYRGVINQILNENNHIKGYRSSLVKAAGCSLSFLSQVLNSSTQLTLDHGANMCDFWGLDEDDVEYFLDLISWERSASVSLRKRLEKRLRDRRVESKRLVKQSASTSLTLSENLKESIYYSSWHYAAIHVLTAIPAYQTIAAIAERLNLPTALIERTLNDLKVIGAVEQKGRLWQALGHSIFLRKESPLSTINQNNWRQQAMKHQAQFPYDGIHYSGLYALSREDGKQLMNMCEDFIRNAHNVVSSSKEEELVCFNMDYFSI